MAYKAEDFNIYDIRYYPKSGDDPKWKSLYALNSKHAARKFLEENPGCELIYLGKRDFMCPVCGHRDPKERWHPSNG